MIFLQTAYDSPLLLPSDLSVLFVVLPLFLLVFYLVPPRRRPAVLLAESLLFYYLAEPSRLPLMLASVAVNYIALRLMERFRHTSTIRKLCFLLPAAGTVAFVALAYRAALSAPLVLGMSMYGLSAVSSLADAYQGVFPPRESPFRFALYCFFFPRLYAGPHLSYEDFSKQLDNLRMEPPAILSGAGQLLHGAFKVMVLGRFLYGELYLALGALDAVTALSSWLQVLSFAFALYFLLSGLGDMARGMGKMFGILLPQNFYYPYQSRSITDFYDRFNMTAGRFFWDFTHAGPWGRGGGMTVECLRILASCVLSGLWLGLGGRNVLWGLYIGLFLVLERYLYPKLLNTVPLLFCRIGTLFLVLTGFSLLAAGSTEEFLPLLRSMFRFGNLYNDQALYLLASNWLLLVAGCFFATSAASLLRTKFRRAAPAVSVAVFGLVDFAVLLLYLALVL